MTEAERENIWYVSATSQKGFTSDPALAIKDLTGAPVIAPGHVKNLLEKQDRQYMRSLDVQRQAVRRVWDAMLDKMESYYELVENGFEETSKELYGKILGMAISLAILEYGHDYKQDPTATIDRVMEMARVRYDMESE